jgi:PAS domain S-box-containing protein
MENQQTLVLTSWNRKALETCTAAYDQHYPLEAAGNWVDCVRERRPVIYNDFPSSPNQKGLPEGHVPITRLLTVPVLEGDEVRIIFGVGNKKEPYDDFDLVQVQLMANDLQKILVRRRIEASLRESERRYREMLDLLPVTVFEADATGRVLSFNPAAYHTFLLHEGATEQPLNLFDFVAPKNGITPKGTLGRSGRQDQPLARIPHAPKRRQRFPGMILSRAISRGDEIIGLRGVVVDLSEIKAAQEALHLSEEKYRSMYENALEGIFQITVDGRFISANPALARMHGFRSPEELMAQVTDIGAQYHVHPETRQDYLSRMERDGFVRNFEFEAYRRDRSRMWASVNARAVKDRDGRVLYHEGTTEDITWRKEAEEQLRQAYQVLKETNEQLIQADKLAAVGTLAAGVAHEILNPIHIIAMGISALESTQDLPKPVREAFAIFQRQIERVVRITKDLQQFSRKSPPEMEETDLRDLVESTLNLCRPQLRMEGIATEVSAEDALPPVWVDRNPMGQVLLNLVSNAIDAMHAQTEKRLRITLRRLPHQVLITVADTGSGIAEADLGHLFDPFFTTKEAGKGTGLGLSISHRIVQNHGGRIWAENNPQGGATFFIELPAEKP